MEERKLKRREFLKLSSLAVVGAAAVACAPTPQVIEKEVTREVEKVVKETVVVEKEKEVTKVVEKEKEVTKIVEKEVTVVVETSELEPPFLAEQVASGALPPVDERVPVDPLVLKPIEKIGQYGGRWENSATGWGVSWDSWGAWCEGFLGHAVDGVTIVPNVVKSYEITDDLKTVTLYLRPGMKWSDGQPFTADDIVFYFEDILANEEITPNVRTTLKPGGEIAKAVKNSDYEVELQFAAANPPVIPLIAKGSFALYYAPRHYLEQFHIDYNDKAGDLAKEAGQEHWYQMVRTPNNMTNGNAQSMDWIEYPLLTSWILKDVDEGQNKYFVRSPYCWKIDPQGRQLPYIDEHALFVVSNTESLNLKVMSGETSIQAIEMDMLNYPLFKENEDQGEFEVRTWPMTTTGVRYAFSPNLTYQDEAYREVFRDLRFRQALSLAIDRDEVNEIMFFGMAVARQATISPSASYYEDWMGDHFAEYDPDRANELLDEMGLEWDTDKKVRLLPDGRPLDLILEFLPVDGPPRLMELMKGYWDAIGTNVILKEQERSVYGTRGRANEMMLSVWNYDGVSEGMIHFNGTKIDPADASQPLWAPLWRNWFVTDGEEGEEPPELVKQVHEAMLTLYASKAGSPEYMEAGKFAATTNVEQLWRIGTVGLVPKPVIVKKGLINVPSEAPYNWDEDFFNPYQEETWFWE